jgi:hypothetical protein
MEYGKMRSIISRVNSVTNVHFLRMSLAGRLAELA